MTPAGEGPAPRFGTPDEFAALREFLCESDYTEAAILARMGIARLSESLGMHSSAPAADRLDLLIQLFLLGESVTEAEAGQYLPAGVLNLLAGLGLLSRTERGFWAPAALYPCGSLYILSDRNQEPELAEARSDKVFAAITPNTEEFLATLPDTPCPAFLDLCCGTAVAALAAASRYAVRAFAYDLSTRSTRFAEFNRRLNRLANVSIACGDLYGPAGRRTFDRIVAHPPYVPSLRPTLLLRDGGEDGEVLTRRIIEGLPNYLHPGGRFYGLALVADVRGDPFAARIRRWLLEAQTEFDVAVMVRRILEPERLIFDNWSAHAQAGDLLRWESILKQRRIKAFHYVSLILERHASPRPAMTLERQVAEPYDPREVEDLLRWAQVETDLDALPLGARPGIEMEVRRRLTEGAWEGEVHRYRIERPFRACYEGDAWVALLLAQCDGTRTCRELFEGLRPVEHYAEFATVVRSLIGEGFLRLPRRAV